MSALLSLGPNHRAAVFGASGGIGAALVALLQADDHCAIVHAGARVTPDAGAKLVPFAFDLEDEHSVAAAAGEITARSKELELVIVATGLLHDDALAPEKSIRALNADALARCYAINAIGPALVAKHAIPLLQRQRKSVFAALSARVGSIAENRLAAGTAIAPPKQRSINSFEPAPLKWRQRTSTRFASRSIQAQLTLAFRVLFRQPCAQGSYSALQRARRTCCA